MCTDNIILPNNMKPQTKRESHEKQDHDKQQQAAAAKLKKLKNCNRYYINWRNAKSSLPSIHRFSFISCVFIIIWFPSWNNLIWLWNIDDDWSECCCCCCWWWSCNCCSLSFSPAMQFVCDVVVQQITGVKFARAHTASTHRQSK